MKELILKTMGTTVVVKIEHKNSDEILESVRKKILDFNNRFSANDKLSQLMAINKNSGKKSVKVDEDLFYLIEYGKKFSISSNLKLNIAIGPIVKKWKIGFYDAKKPTDNEIKNTLNLISPKKIELDNDEKTVYLKEEGMEIDLGAIAKGYFADEIKKYLKLKEVNRGIIDFGGNVLTIGESSNNAGNWLVGIQNPKKPRGNLLGIVKVKDKSVVTSGIYERMFILGDEQYHHIFDSYTGYPIDTNIASIAIVATNSLTCELWTTILFGYSIDKAINLINNNLDIEGIIIDKNNNLYLSRGILNDFIEIK